MLTVGRSSALTMELPNHADDEVAPWIADDSPPIFWFEACRSMPPPERSRMTVRHVRNWVNVLIGAGWSNFRDIPTLPIMSKRSAR